MNAGHQALGTMGGGIEIAVVEHRSGCQRTLKKVVNR